jgi:diadenylate cyclase
MKSINKTMIESAIKLAQEVKADHFLVCIDVKSDLADLPEEIKKSVNFLVVTRDDEELPAQIAKYAKKLNVPNVNLTRVGKIKIAIAKGIILGYFKKGDKIVCLSVKNLKF